jgi:hypothetical protein
MFEKGAVMRVNRIASMRKVLGRECLVGERKSLDMRMKPIVSNEPNYF